MKERQLEREREADTAPDNLDNFHIFMFALSCTIVLVPAGLLELRYFQVPALIVLLHLPHDFHENGTDKQGGVKVWVWELLGIAMNAYIDIACLYIFLNRPFKAPDGSVGRFIF